jgi:transcriptional regulator with XRE-family HTH domain
MNRNEFAIEKIKELYREQRYTMSQFADLVGKSKSAWIRREQGAVPLTLDEIDDIAEKIGSDFGTLTNSNNSFIVNNKGIVANSGTNASITINLSTEQYNKVLEMLSES